MYILPKNWVFYKSLFGGIEFFINYNGQFFYKIQTVFYKKKIVFYKYACFIENNNFELKRAHFYNIWQILCQITCMYEIYRCITYFIGTCKQYNRPAIQYNTRFVSPFIYFLDNAYIYQLVHRHSTLTWHHFCQKIWGNLLFSSFCLKVLIAGPRSSSGQPTLTFYLSEMSATFSFPVGISCQVFKQLVYFGLASQQNLHDLHAHQLSQNLQWADSSSKLYTYIFS